MREQLLLFAEPEPPEAECDLTCDFGEPWLGPHPLCELQALAMRRRFAQAVAAGIYDAEGYKPAERRRQKRVSESEKEAMEP